MVQPDAATVWRPAHPVDAHLTLSALGRGRADPCHQLANDGALWRTSRMSTGPVTYRIIQSTPTQITAHAWGPGAAELITGLPTLLGGRDNPADFQPRHPLLYQAHTRLTGLRVPRTGRVLEALLPAILEQRVLTIDATAAWRRLLTRYGDPAPGPAPAGMRVIPTVQAWQRIPSWDWHRAGVDPRRARTITTCLPYIGKLERSHATNPDNPTVVYRLLRALPGIGVWTAAQVGHRALGDPDAAPIGDYHLATLLGHALTGAPLADDHVETFLQPWRPHRYRLVRLLELTPHAHRPRRGPRLARQDHRHR